MSTVTEEGPCWLSRSSSIKVFIFASLSQLFESRTVTEIIQLSHKLSASFEKCFASTSFLSILLGAQRRSIDNK